MSERFDQLAVVVDSIDFGDRKPVGSLSRTRRGSTEVMSFSFAADWLRLGSRPVLDPVLGLFEGDQYAQGGGLFGIFADAAPDRWGRTLLQRREAVLARRQGRRPRTLDEWDFLTGVSDELRMGALRLGISFDGPFISELKTPVPPLARLRQLEAFAARAERGEHVKPDEEQEELALLIAPGSSLGGTRPKANFETDGQLWIAKFPSRTDTWDVGAWEFVVTQMAGQVGILVPEVKLMRLGSDQHTFAGKRFDRNDMGRKLYASAMTLTGKRDHEPASYIDIAEAIAQYGDPRAIDEDLEQLVRRVIFNVLTSNRDDHLRNHGFLGTQQGWRLSPAFDINPLPTKAEHAIAIDESDHSPDLDLISGAAGYYRVKRGRLDSLLMEIRDVVKKWRQLAEAAGLNRDETERMEAAFER